MKKKINSSKGFVMAEATLGIVIFVILSSVVILLVFNVYNANLSIHRLAVATDYAVEILEKAKISDYDDVVSRSGSYILGVDIDEKYTASLDVKKYNEIAGNEDKSDLIKIVTVNIKYLDGNLTKNIEMETLVINNNN